MQRISISHFNNAHNDWLRSLDFYKQELSMLRERLTEVASKNSHADVLKEVEHYENQFKIQIDNIQTLAHEIKANLSNLAHQAQDAKAGYIDGALMDQHNELGGKFNTEEEIIKELRKAFNVFAAKWM